MSRFFLFAFLICSLVHVCSFAEEKVYTVTVPKKNSRVKLETTLGPIVLELNQEKAPLTVQNFLKYVEDGFYDHTIFHRVIDNFMVQGGGFTKGMSQKETRQPIKNEASNGLKNVKGSVAMARTSDPHSATAQFFINVVDNPFLDFRSESPEGYGYTVFGKVVEGENVIDQIKKVPTTSNGPYKDVPVNVIEITKAQVLP